MRRHEHTHPCQHCGAKVPCDAKLEQNYDGWPEVICPVFHLPGGLNEDFVCEDCLVEHEHGRDFLEPEDDPEDEAGA